MFAFTTPLRRIAVFGLSVIVAILLTISGSFPSFAATASGLTLSVVGDDTAAAISDSSTTNGIVPVTGGQLTYRWGWSSVPGGGDVVFSQTLPTGVTWNAASIASGCSVTGSFLTSGETLTCTISGLADIPGTTDKSATVKNLAGGVTISSKLVSGSNESSTVSVITGSTSQVQVQVARGGSSYMTDAKDPATGLTSGLQVPFAMALYVPGTSTDRLKGQESFGSSATLSYAVTVPANAQLISCGTSSVYQHDGSFATLPSFGTGASTATNRAANSGTMTCSQSGSTVTVTFTGVDARLNHTPSSSAIFWPSKGIFALGGMYLWMPGSAFNTSTSTNVTVSTVPSTFTTISGLTSTNSAASVSYPILLNAFALNQSTATVSNSTPYAAQNYSQNTQLTVPSGSGTSATGVQLCQVWDNSLQRIRTDVAQPSYSGVNITGLLLSHFTIEYGTVVYADDAARRAADCGSVGDGSTSWFSSVAAAGGASEVSAVRIKYLRALDPGQFLNVNVNVTAPSRSDLLPTVANTAGVTYLQFFNNRKSDQTSVQRLTSSYSSRATMSMASVRNTITFPSTDVKPGATTTVTLTPTVTTGNVAVADGRLAVGVTETVTLPNGCYTFVPGTPAPVSVTPASPASPAAGADCSTVAGQVVVWNLGDVSTSTGASPISFALNLSPSTPTPVVATITAVIASNSDKISATTRTSTDTINVNTVNQFQVSLTSSTANINTGIPFSYRVGWNNASSSDISGAGYVVDLLPFAGDDRGTSDLGGLTLNSVTTSPSGRPVEYTTDTAAEVKTALASDPSGGTGITWVTSLPASGTTAVRVRTQDLTAGASGYMDINVTPVNFAAGGVIANDVYAKADSLLSGFSGSEDLALNSSSSTVSGSVFHDSDYSGTQNVGDDGVSGVTVTLSGFNFGPNGINNTGANASVQGDDIAVSSTATSDVSGAYSFTVSPGVYTVTTPSTTTINSATTNLIVQPSARFEVSGAVTVTGKNFGYQEPINPPVAVDDNSSTNSSLTIDQGQSVTVDVLHNDTVYVPSGVPATTIVSNTSPARGTLVLNGDSTFTYTANSVWPGSVSGLTYTSTFTYTISNPQGSSTGTVTVTVRRLPSATADTGVAADQGSVTLSVLSNDFGDTVSLDSTQTPSTDGAGSVSVSGSNLVFTAGTHSWSAAEESYTETITYRIVDTRGNYSTGSAVVTVYRAPIVVNDTAVTAHNTAVTVSVTANDTIPRGPGTVSITSQPATGSATESGSSIVFTPTPTQHGTVTVGYRVTDALGQTTNGTVSVTVAESFTVANEGSSGSRVRVPETGTDFDVLDNDSGTNLTIESVTTPVNGTATESGGVIQYTPTAGYSGADFFEYTVSDITGAELSAYVYLTVVAAPVTADDSGWVEIGTAKTFDVADNDSINGAATITITSAPSSGSATVLNGAIRFTPGSAAGTVTIGYQIADDLGQSDTGLLTVTVVEEVLAVDDYSSVTPREIPQSGSTFNVLDNDSGTDIALDDVGTPGFGTATINEDVIDYVPMSGFAGPDSFTYTVVDSVGRTESATVYLTVIAPPVAVDDTGWASPGVTKSFSVVANDTVHSLTSVEIVAQPSAGMGTASVSGTSISFAPGVTEGEALISYRITDSVGQMDDATLTVSIVNGFTVFDDGSLADPLVVGSSGRTIDVLANDAGTGLTITSVTTPSHGTAQILSNRIVYVPTAGYRGTDTFTYTARDAGNQTRTGTVHVTVLRALELTDDSTWTTTDSPITIDVLDNDDIGDISALEIAEEPVNGAATFIGTEIRFVPDGTVGTESLTYRVTDTAGQTATATVTIAVVETLAAADDGSSSTPLLLPQALSRIDALANDVGTDVSIASVADPEHGTASIHNGVIRYTPDTGWAGPDSFVYTAVDQVGQEDSATVFVLVVSAPILFPDSAQTMSTTPVTVDVLANDTVGAGSVLAISSQPALGRATLSGDRITFTPALASEGAQIVGYRVTDTIGQTAKSRLTVDVRTDFIARDDGSPAVPLVVPRDGRSISVLINDEGAGLSIVSVSKRPTLGTATILGESIAYQPFAESEGPDSFVYQIEDRYGNRAQATVYLRVAERAVVAPEPVDETADPVNPTRIDLTEYDEAYSNGKTLGVNAGQVIHFTVPKSDTEESNHTITVGAIGPDYIDVTIRSEPIRDRIYLQKTEQYDVDFDGDMDVEATLESINGAKADVTFTILAKPETPASNTISLSLAASGILIAGVAAVIVIRRRRRG